MPRNPATRLRYVSVAEAVSFLLLLFATLLKYAGPQEAIGVEVLGPIHGGLFLLYVVLALDLWRRRHWRLGRAVVILGAAVVPAAPVGVAERMLRTDEAALEPHAQDGGGQSARLQHPDVSSW